MTEAKPLNYWISPTALRITLNALSDADYMQASAASGAMIMCYMKGIDGLEFDHGHNYKRWPLRISPTYFTTTTRKYVYAKIPKPSTDAADVESDIAQIVFPSDRIDIYGQTEDGRQIGDEGYYYIYLQGIISAPEPQEEGLRRRWEQEIDTGSLGADEATEAGGTGEWWSYNPITDMVTFLKKIAYAAFEFLKADQAEITDLVSDNVTVNKLLKAYNAYINKVQSTNYTGDGLLDTGWRITNDYEGGNSAATFDYLTIRKKAFFNELEIRKLTSIGGNFCLSPASGRIYRIEWYDGQDNLLGYDYYNVPWSVGGRILGLFSKSLAQKFLGKRKRLARRLTDEERVNMRRIRCYFYTDDGTTSTMLNWTVGAQARCQTFNIDEQMDHISGGETDNDDVGFYDKDMYGGVDFYRGHKVSNTYWWRLVTAVGKGRLDDGKQHYYIEFMVNTGSDATHQDAGSDLPSVGDQVVQFGHRTRTDQQNVIMFETASVEAPCIKMYENINSWNLNNKLVARMSPKGWKVAANKFEWMTAYGEKGVTIIRGLWVDIEKDANGQRRCYYNDVVSHNGSYWRCIVNEGTHKEDKAMTHWYTQEEIDHMSLEDQMELIDVPNYTTVEPGDATFEQQAVWQVEVSIGISPYLVISPALVAVPCEKDGKATDAYSVSASVKLMVTNLEASITSISMDGADANVKLSGNYVSVNFAKGAAVANKDYLLTVDGTLNGQKYTATDKVSVYAVIRGNDAYEVSAMPGQWLWNQAGANYTYEDIMRMIEEGTSPSDFGIEIDKVETLPNGQLGNSCTQLSVVNGGVAQAFQIVSVAPSDSHVTASYNNVTGRVWVTSVPNTLESGYIDVTVRYGSNVQRTVRVPFWCNLLGTWREIILGDTRASIAEKTEYYVNENQKALTQYNQNLQTAKSELQDVITANEEARDNADQIMKDGLITDDEKTVLRSIRKSLQTEYNEAVQAYTPVYGNANLNGTTEKTALATAKSEMDTAYNAVIAKIDQLLALTKIDKNGADQVNTTFNTFDTKLQAYRRALEAATNKIINVGDEAVNTKYTEFRAEYLQSSKETSEKFTAISGILGENGEKIVTQTEFGTYKRSASENLSQLSREVNTELGKKLNTSEFKQTADGFNLITTTQAQTMANSAENNAKNAAQGYADNAQSNIETKLFQTGINIDGNNREINLIAGKVNFLKGDGDTVNPYISIKEDGSISATGEFRVVDSDNAGVVRINAGDNAAGSSEKNVTIVDASGFYSRGDTDGFKMVHDRFGTRLLRWDALKSMWVPFYAARNVRGVYRNTDVEVEYDDFIICMSGELTLTFPSSGAREGKVISIKATGYEVTLKSSSQIFLRNSSDPKSELALHGWDRAELVYWGGYWYWSYMEP